MDIYANKVIVIEVRVGIALDSDRGDNVRRGYDRVEGSIGRSYDEIEGVTLSVNRNFHMLSEITTGKKVEKLDCLSIAKVVNMDVEVAS